MIIFTNGCFDVLHRGHVELLKFAKSLGDQLIVGINSDNSVRRLKGAGRPVNSQIDRLEVLRAIRYVDSVEIFEEDTPQILIEKIRPSIIVKGGDYTQEQVVGGELAEIVIFPLVPGKSSSTIINKLNRLG